MFKRDRAGDVGATGEGNDAHAVILTLIDKCLCGVFCHGNALGTSAVEHEVDNLHRVGNVDGEDDIDTTCGAL